MEVGEVYICRDVLSAWIVVNRASLKALLQQIGADAALRAAMIEVPDSCAVVDSEHAAGFPKGQPFMEIAPVGIVDFDPLSDFKAVLKCG